MILCKMDAAVFVFPPNNHFQQKEKKCRNWVRKHLERARTVG